jgi:hypothetical protein
MCDSCRVELLVNTFDSGLHFAAPRLCPAEMSSSRRALNALVRLSIIVTTGYLARSGVLGAIPQVRQPDFFKFPDVCNIPATMTIDYKEIHRLHRRAQTPDQRALSSAEGDRQS